MEVTIGSYFLYKYKNPFTLVVSMCVLQVTQIHNSLISLKTIDNKIFKRKLKTRPSGTYYVEHDAFGTGGRNKFDYISEFDLNELIPGVCRPDISQMILERPK